MDVQTLLAYFFILVLVYVLFRFLYGPLRLLARVAYRTAIGACLLWVLDLGGNLLGYHLALNLPTAMAAGLLGLPGVVLVLVLQKLLT